MKKIINIDGKDYTMKSSAYTQFAYRNLTGRSLLKDIQNILDLTNKLENDFSAVDDLTEPLLDLSYVMIEEADPSQITTKEEFIKSIDNLYDNYDWVNEVITLAVNPLSRQLQNNKVQ